MPVGDTERGVAASAAAAGVVLTPMPRVPWLNTRGHFDLPAEAAPAVPILQRAFELLGGDEVEQRAKQRRPLPSDLLHAQTRTMVEVDEHQHFTSFRARTLDLLDADHAGFAVEHYRALCVDLAPQSDRYRAAKQAKGFPGECSRGRQRAYNDLLRDVVAPLMGYRVVRVSAPHMTGAEAYAGAREQLAALVR